MQIPVTNLYEALEDYMYRLIWVTIHAHDFELYNIRINGHTQIVLLDIDNTNSTWLSLYYPWSLADTDLPELRHYIYLYAK